VAGTLAAVGDNGLGVAGVSWHSGLAALRVLANNGSARTIPAATPAEVPGQQGLPVANMSLGSAGPSQAMEDALAAAPRTLFIVASGNAAGW